jgi:hypothetical protein
MGICCLKPDAHTTLVEEKEEESSNLMKVDCFQENSGDLIRTINDEGSKVTSFTDEERENWVHNH